MAPHQTRTRPQRPAATAAVAARGAPTSAGARTRGASVRDASAVRGGAAFGDVTQRPLRPKVTKVTASVTSAGS